MKKIILLAAAIISFATVTSCDNDDDASLTGKWEFSKEGYAENGQEFLEDYEHQAGCSKDYLLITATTIADHSFFETTCEEDIITNTYTRNGNTITISEEGEIFQVQINTLNGTTLKVSFTDPDFPGESMVTVFKRVN